MSLTLHNLRGLQSWIRTRTRAHPTELDRALRGPMRTRMCMCMRARIHVELQRGQCHVPRGIGMRMYTCRCMCWCRRRKLSLAARRTCPYTWRVGCKRDRSCCKQDPVACKRNRGFPKQYPWMHLRGPRIDCIMGPLARKQMQCAHKARQGPKETHRVLQASTKLYATRSPTQSYRTLHNPMWP